METLNQKNEVVENHYALINNSGLRLQYNAALVLAIFAFIAEVVISIYIIQTPLLESTFPVYVMKFIVAPTLMNAVLLLVGHFVIHYSEMEFSNKALSMSLILVAMSFVLFSAHSAFTATYYFYTLAVFLSVIYADYKVTRTTFIVSLSSLVISELFLFWDVDRVSILVDPARMVNFFTAVAILIATTIISFIVVRFEKSKNDLSIELENQRTILESRLRYDEMTGLYNKLELQNAFSTMKIHNEFDRHVFVFLDIDNFKQVNDICGHQTGDECIGQLASIFLDYRESFKAFRYGGDEFCLLSQDMSLRDVIKLCKTINTQFIDAIRPKIGDLDVSISFGASQCRSNQSISDLIENTDKALYEAKRRRTVVEIGR